MFFQTVFRRLFTVILMLVLSSGLILTNCNNPSGSQGDENSGDGGEQQEQTGREHPFAGGEGTESNPYEIETFGQLDSVRLHPNSHFVQIADIDASVTGSDHNFLPIGFDESFNGSYNGDGYAIVDLTIDINGEGVGLFGRVGMNNADSDPVVLENMVLENVSISGGGYVGALYGNKGSSTVEVTNSYATGEVSGSSFVGGLVGHGANISDSYANCTVEANDIAGGLIGAIREEDDGNISDSYAEGTVTVEGEKAGGLVGWIVGSNNIKDSYATGDVTAESEVGGLVGILEGLEDGNEIPEVLNSYAEGNVSGQRAAGGLIGVSVAGKVDNTHAKGNVEITRNIAGGLVGINVREYGKGGQLLNSYAEGDVDGGSKAGGLAGSNNGGLVSSTVAKGSVSGTFDVGGLVGRNAGEINKSQAEGDVEGGEFAGEAGGLVGINVGNGSILRSSALGNVSGNENVGGLIGYNDGSDGDEPEVLNTYALGDVTGNSNVGGLVGRHQNSKINASYSTGKVAGSNAGGSVGLNEGDGQAIYWDVENSGVSESVAVGDTYYFEELTTSEMTGTSAKANMTGLDFENTWTTTDNYPKLAWQQN